MRSDTKMTADASVRVIHPRGPGGIPGPGRGIIGLRSVTMAIEPAPSGDWQEMRARRFTALLLTGRPGVGKTTIVTRVAKGLERKPGGFYTEEVRERGERRGFRAVTFAGDARAIADVDFRGTPRVGRYGVD